MQRWKIDLTHRSSVYLTMTKGWSKGHLFDLFKIYLLCICGQCMRVGMPVCHGPHVMTGKQLMGDSMGSRDQMQVIRLGRKYLCQLSHLADPEKVLQYPQSYSISQTWGKNWMSFLIKLCWKPTLMLLILKCCLLITVCNYYRTGHSYSSIIYRLLQIRSQLATSM